MFHFQFSLFFFKIRNFFYIKKVKSLNDMSSYEIGAFEALEWVWHILRTQKEHKSSLDETTKQIQNTLSIIGHGKNVDFKKLTIEMNLI